MSTPYPGSPGPWGPPPGSPPQGPPQGPPQWSPPPPPSGPGWTPPAPGGPDPYGGGPNPYGGGPGWAPPPPPGAYPGGPGGPPPKRSRTGLVLGLVGAAVVLVLVAGAALVLVTRSDDGGGGDFGAGPRSEPEEAWAVDVDLGDDEDADAAVLSDGARAYVLTEAVDDGTDDFSTTVTVTAYAAGDGEELWTDEIGGDLFDDPVRLLGGDQLLLADDEDESTRLIDADTGDEVWEADGRPVDTQLSLGFGPPIDPGELDQVFLAIEDDDGDASVVAVDRESGDELWEEEGDDAVVCGDVVVTIAEGEPDEETFAPTDAEVTGRDGTTGEELWAMDALPGLCDDGEIALGTDDDEITLVDVASGDEGTVIDLPGEGDFLVGTPFGDHVAVSQYSFSEEDAMAQASIHPRAGGDATWEDDDSFVFPVTDDLVLVGDEEGDDATIVRAADGEEVGDLTITGGENECDGALTRQTVVVCETGRADVSSYRLDTGFEELWTVDAGADVVQLAVGGDTAFVITDREELVALR